MAEQRTITIRIHCYALPGASFAGRTGARLGVQKGKDVIDAVPGDASKVSFTLSFRVEKHPQTGRPNFLGPYAHGPVHERFIYLCWGECKDDHWEGFGRVKIHLNHFDWPLIESVIQQGIAIEAKVRMTDQKGAPRYASIKGDGIEWSPSSPTVEPTSARR